MSSTRTRQYENRDSGINSDQLSARLAADLRVHIRSLALYPIFSREWFAMVESLQHISSIALMEDRLQSGATPTTLWEREELTIRFILEEGKLNVSLRNMVDYFEFKQSYLKNPSTALLKYIQGTGQDQATLESKMFLYEQSLGMLLRCAFLSVESLQTLDLTLLLTHVTAVLQAAIADTAAPADHAQGSLVLHYLSSTALHLEKLNEDRVASLLESNDIVTLVIQLLHKHGKSISKEYVLSGAYFLSGIFQSDAYLSRRSKYIKNQETKKQLVEVRSTLLAEYEGSLETRRKLQGLIEQSADFKRSL
eukprot:TRINITY_DN8816_c0_g1_i1.p1 TRINITY_DN8816_c0_g1~~TRINITY_DN8816_c0_g1_i1.p1  ORF type:complete len:308 (-),score=78.77 TRINITY_DN8816_c0_g1_i1:335-1258(-)